MALIIIDKVILFKNNLNIYQVKLTKLISIVIIHKLIIMDIHYKRMDSKFINQVSIIRQVVFIIINNHILYLAILILLKIQIFLLVKSTPKLQKLVKVMDDFVISQLTLYQILFQEMLTYEYREILVNLYESHLLFRQFMNLNMILFIILYYLRFY